MLCWGRASEGQLGLGTPEGGRGLEEEFVLQPKENRFFSGRGSTGQGR